ncbi:MAG: hypothetical protein P4M15_15470 [Alphaproteobacteria bacterium]|nr:hypothetical protein [Alphaproteobacteria bacterium]
MFLVVFVTLALSVMGVFAQVVSLQSAQIANAQTTLADTMETWHSIALKQTLVNPPTSFSTTGCSLTPVVTGGNNPLATCSGKIGGIASNLTISTNTTPTGTVSLPPGYQSVYGFYSVVFQSLPFVGAPNAVTYVLTYAAPNSQGQLTLSNGASSGFTTSDLLNQLHRNSSPTLTYGTVQGGTLTATSKATTVTDAATNTVSSTLAYVVPTSIPNGSVAIISTAE